MLSTDKQESYTKDYSYLSVWELSERGPRTGFNSRAQLALGSVPKLNKML